jgi:DNA-binding beta-propeller fold protein YncE
MRIPQLFCATRFRLFPFVLIASMFLLCILSFPSSSFALGVNPVTIASTVPGNGDVNPYGIARVPRTTGLLVKGNILVSNFNNISNLQGTGTTIVQITPNGAVSLFAQIDASTLPGPCPGGIGLTTALVVLREGWVVVGSLPTTDGTSATAQAGCLLVLNSQGQVVETFYGSLIDGPWDMTALDAGSTAALFVTNVLNGTIAANGKVVHGGTVVRLMLSVSQAAMPSLQSITVVGSGFPERSDPAAVVVGPTGLALSPDGSTLYVADSLNNRIASIADPLLRISTAGRGVTLTKGGNLKDPLGLAVAADGNILSVNGTNGYLTETTPEGLQVATVLLDSTGTPPGAGALFGLISVQGQGIYYVDDASNTLNLLH